MRIFSNKSLERMAGLHPVLMAILFEALEGSPYDFGVASGVRTTEQQKALYAKGRTVPGKIVTNCDGVKKKSNHQAKADGYGYAVDLYGWDGKALWDKASLSAIAGHIKEAAQKYPCKLQWGGDWKSFKDYPHIELVSYG